jgi:hypothetical protein
MELYPSRGGLGEQENLFRRTPAFAEERPAIGCGLHRTRLIENPPSSSRQPLSILFFESNFQMALLLSPAWSMLDSIAISPCKITTAFPTAPAALLKAGCCGASLSVTPDVLTAWSPSRMKESLG